jgi:type I restriction enzyme S subunit
MRIGDYCSVKSGYAFESSQFESNGIPVIRISDIQDSRVHTENSVRVQEFSLDGDYVLQTGDFVIAMSGATTGKIGMYRNPHISYVNQRVGKFIVKDKEQLYPDYLYHAMNSKNFGNQLAKVLEQGAQPNISSRLIESFLISVPDSILEQEAIAEALSDIDELIETLKQEIDKKVNLLRALSQKLVPWTFLTSLPSGWSLVTLGDSGTISGAGVDKVFRADETEVTLINYMDVYRNDGLSKELNFSKTTATAKQISNCSLREKDVLFTPTSETPEDIARSSVIVNDIPNAVYSYHLIRFRPNRQFDLNYLKHVFDIYDFRSQVRKSAEGSGTRYVITLPRFRSLAIPVPNLSTQSYIGSILDEASTEIKKLGIELGKYERLKQGMMNDLLTGKVRLV